MRAPHHDSNAPGNKLRAGVCLLAALLLWAPGWATAFQASQTACCAGGMCPLHGHAPKKSSTDGKAGQESPMSDCEHHGRQTAMDCILACCRPAEASVTAGTVFVLPSAAEISTPGIAGPALLNFCPEAHSSIFDPASPPPRTSFHQI